MIAVAALHDIYQLNVFPDMTKESDEQQNASNYDIILVVEEFLACARNLCTQLVSYQCSFTDLRRHCIELKGTRTTSFWGKILSVLIHVDPTNPFLLAFIYCTYNLARLFF